MFRLSNCILTWRFLPPAAAGRRTEGSGATDGKPS